MIGCSQVGAANGWAPSLRAAEYTSPTMGTLIEAPGDLLLENIPAAG